MRNPVGEPKGEPKPQGALGDRFWRLSALLALCLMVYYFSYDHGRSSVKARLEREMAENRELRRELALKLEEIESLKISCAGLKPERTNSGPIDSDQKPGPVIFAARVGENKYFFNDRLILTVVDINNLDREAAIRLHFVDTARRETSLVKVGEPLTINFEGQESQVFLDQLKGSVAYFSFYENQSRPEKPKATEEPNKSENSEESAAS